MAQYIDIELDLLTIEDITFTIGLSVCFENISM